MLKNKAIIKWIVVLILIIITILMLHSFMLRLVIRWGAAFISFSAAACIFYYFLGIFPSLNKKRTVKYFLTLCMICLSVFIYHESHKIKVVHMKEEVIYISPKSDTIIKN